jgi:ABC-type phosphate/phosphonate transport system substrate-binding protein
MPNPEAIIDKIKNLFIKLPTINEEKRCLENLTILMNERIEKENKLLQETIEANNKLKN